MIETAYLLQAVLIIAWWIGITLSEAFYEAFRFPGIDREVFSAFFMPDIAIIAALSLLRAYKSSRDLQLIILGAFVYAALFCVNASILGGGGYLAVSAMLVGLCYNISLSYQHQMFRAASSGLLFNAIKTFVQIICVWFLSLGLIPFLILKAFGEPFVPTWGLHFWVGALGFVFSSSLGLWSACVLVGRGKGTPLPLDQTNELVTSGPYGYVRNPMAVAGIGQGIAIGIIYMSLPIVVYSALGAFVWQYVVRPIEERDMHNRFSDSYRDYQSRVRCWIPRSTNDAE